MIVGDEPLDAARRRLRCAGWHGSSASICSPCAAAGSQGGSRSATSRAFQATAAGGGRRIPIRGIRRAIVEQVERTHREIPAVTFVEECDFTGTDVSLLVAATLKAAAESLRAFPELNARIEGDEIVLLERYDIGVAVENRRRPAGAGRRAAATGSLSMRSTPRSGGSPTVPAPARCRATSSATRRSP